MSNFADLSDVDLRRKLKENGFDAGPITDGTRTVYEKTLLKLLNNESPSVSSAGSSRASVSKESKNRRRSTPLRSSQTQASVLGFSSEDSESESTSTSTHTGIGNSLSSSSLSNKQKQQRRRTLPASPLSIDLPIKKKTSAIVNAYKHEHYPASRSKRSEATSYSTTIASPSSSNLSYEEARNRSFENIERALNVPGSLTRSKLTTSRGSTGHFDEDFSDVEVPSNHNFNSRLSSLPSATSKPGIFSKSNFFQNLRSLPYKRSFVGQAKKNFTHSLNGSQSRNSVFEKEFRTTDDLKNATNYSQCVSWLLVGFVLIFFVVLGMIYLGAKQKDANISSSLKSFSNHICKGFSTINCIEKKDILEAVKAARQLHEILAVEAGKFECSEGVRQKRSMELSEAKQALQNKMGLDEEEMEVAFANCLILIENHPEWGVIIMKHDDSTDRIRALEAKTSSKSFLCRFSQAFKLVFSQFMLAIFVIAFLAGGALGIRIFYRKKREREQQLYELIENVTDILRKRQVACQSNPDMDACLPVVHVRDMLIPPAQRSLTDWQGLWDRAVKFLKENESRIRTETQRVAGEDFLVFRWLQPSTPEGIKRKGKTWQGQAFENSGSRNNVLPFSPTPCLKIRNMFDPDVEIEETWPASIQDAILEKCEGNNGIVHVHIEEPSKEGCVYLKCNSSESAGQAYKALHGWWFDGKLVTVKYLRLERYNERFPNSKYGTTPLKPSNSLRLSLQNPQNSSSSMLEHT